ncbi:MAG: GerAB/ArcD/ProY family transporter [Oscillospiraceae bacterium]|nr:GerAB/ArcD/ProY family transporter [Oscillospiraceae bacterium]
MNEKISAKISTGQMFILLILARIMHTMVFHSADFSVGTFMLPTLVVTTLIEAALALPALILIDGGVDIVRELSGGYRWIYALLRALYSLYFIYIATGTIKYIAEFMHSEFRRVISPIAVIVILSLAAAYCAHLGIEALARAGTVVFWIFISLFVSMAAVSEGTFNTSNLTPITGNDFPAILDYAVRDLSSSWWLPMLVILGHHLNDSKDGAKKAAAGYLGFKLLMLEVLALLIILVLGKFADILGYPLLALGAYARTVFVQSFDAVNMFVWCMNAALVCGIYLFIASDGLKDKKRTAGELSAMLITAVAAILAYDFELDFNGEVALIIKTAGILLLGVLLPTILLAERGIRRCVNSLQ